MFVKRKKESERKTATTKRQRKKELDFFVLFFYRENEKETKPPSPAREGKHRRRTATRRRQNIYLGLRSTRMTESPRRNILGTNRSRATLARRCPPAAPPLPPPFFGASVHISLTFSRTMLQCRSNACVFFYFLGFERGVEVEVEVEVMRRSKNGDRRFLDLFSLFFFFFSSISDSSTLLFSP